MSEPARVAGDHCPRSICEMERAALVLITEEQEKPYPDQTLLAFLSDTVRLLREISKSSNGYPPPAYLSRPGSRIPLV